MRVSSTTRGRLLLAVGSTILLVGAYLPPALERYGILDDYSLLWWHMHRFPGGYLPLVASGRPLLGALEAWIFGAAGGIDDLVWIRVGALLAVCLFALLVAWQLKGAGWSDLEAAACALIVCSLPPFHVYVLWATQGVTFLACLLSGLAVVGFLESWSATGRRQWRTALAAFVCMLAALTIHQSFAMFAWFFLALGLLRTDVSSTGDFLRRAAWVMCWLGLSLVVAYAVWKIGQAACPGLIWGPRTTLTADPVRKMAYFGDCLRVDLCLSNVDVTLSLAGAFSYVGASLPLSLAEALSGVNVSLPLAGAVAALLLIGLACALKGPPWERLVRLVVLLALLPAALLPNLVSAESNVTYRTQGPMMALIALYLCCGVRALVGKRGAGAILAGWAVVGLVAAHYNAAAYLARPQAAELAFLRQRLADCDLSRPLWVIACGWQDTCAPASLQDDYGLPSSCKPWALESMVPLLLRQMHGDWQGVDLNLLDSDVAWCPPPRVQLIEMRGIRGR